MAIIGIGALDNYNVVIERSEKAISSDISVIVFAHTGSPTPSISGIDYHLTDNPEKEMIDTLIQGKLMELSGERFPLTAPSGTSSRGPGSITLNELHSLKHTTGRNSCSPLSASMKDQPSMTKYDSSGVLKGLPI